MNLRLQSLLQVAVNISKMVSLSLNVRQVKSVSNLSVIIIVKICINSIISKASSMPHFLNQFLSYSNMFLKVIIVLPLKSNITVFLVALVG